MAKVQFPLGGNIGVGSNDWISSVTGQGADLYVVSKDRGSDDNDGKSIDTALRTIQKAIDLATDNRLTVIRIEPGTYAENVNVNKRRIALIGDPRHPGTVSVDGDGGVTARASIYVGNGFLNGFVMANMSAGTGGATGATEQTRPVIHLVTDDTGDLNAESADYYFLLENIHIVGGTVPVAALLLEGATMGIIKNSTFAGCDLGIVLSGSVSNNPADLCFHNICFYNNVRADVATASTNAVGGHPTLITLAAVDSLESIIFERPFFMDRGGTPVTNFVNMVSAAAVNVGFYDFYAARDVADGTLMLLPADVIALGHSAAGLESIIGA